MGRDESDASRSDANVPPCVSADEGEGGIAKFDFERPTVIPTGTALIRIPAPLRIKITSRSVRRTSSAEPARPVNGLPVESGSLNVGLLLDVDCFIADTAAGQIGQQDGEKVIVNLCRVWSSDLVELHRSVPPERDLLQADQVGRAAAISSASNLLRVAESVRSTISRNSSFARPNASAPARPGRSSAARIGRFDIPPEVDVTGHHGQRWWSAGGMPADNSPRRSRIAQWIRRRRCAIPDARD